MLLVKTFLIFLYAEFWFFCSSLRETSPLHCDYWEQNNQSLSSVYRYFSRRSILAVTVWNTFFVILNNSWPNVSAFQTDRVMRPCLETRKMFPNRSIGRKRVEYEPNRSIGRKRISTNPAQANRFSAVSHEWLKTSPYFAKDLDYFSYEIPPWKADH